MPPRPPHHSSEKMSSRAKSRDLLFARAQHPLPIQPRPSKRTHMHRTANVNERAATSLAALCHPERSRGISRRRYVVATRQTEPRQLWSGEFPAAHTPSHPASVTSKPCEESAFSRSSIQPRPSGRRYNRRNDLQLLPSSADTLVPPESDHGVKPYMRLAA